MAPGNHERAGTWHEEALALRRETGDRLGVAVSLSNLGLVAAGTGDFARAAALTGASLELDVEFSNHRNLADSFENLALIAVATRDDERAARHFGAAEALRTRIGVPGHPGDRAYNERWIANLRARMGETTFAAVWKIGRAMSLDEAIADAMAPTRRHPSGAATA